jgi:nicotinamide riboside transporter PnuC
MLDKLAALSHTVKFHVLTVIAFLVTMAVGYTFGGGLDFVQGWGGGFAAVIATYFLMFKSQGYWAWMIVNAGLWTYLFFHTGIPMLAWLQVGFMIFACYGLVQWALVKYRIGMDLGAYTDRVGAFLIGALGILAMIVYYPDTMTIWWALEAGSVLFAMAAMFMDAFKYKGNWIAWTLGNVCSAPLFLHLALIYGAAYWGAFFTLFIYQAINFVGYYIWYKEEKQLLAEGKVVKVSTFRKIAQRFQSRKVEVAS